MDHSESLQVMKKNYDSMVTELEKLRAELTNTANHEKSGMPVHFITVWIFICKKQPFAAAVMLRLT